ncbi:uncharacterized protein LOC110809654 [Carica papaya]|uniref:uncharacterized protein LOC110809654 n=1 Tax=Carica papaya TaxID=3649 RepID=UPI000B8CC96F|nr:uncharacterized protein LOC110809654 [Carica papaya]
MTIEATPTGNAETERRKEIQVSKNKKPLFFYVNIAKEYMQQRNEAELSTFSSTYGGNKTESRVTDASLGVRAAQVERKRKLEEERKAARLALDKMENTDCLTITCTLCESLRNLSD